MTDPGEKLARKAAEAAEDKKADDVVILDVREMTPIVDYFVICSAPTRIQVQAISRAVRERLTEVGAALLRQEGGDESGWILLDYGSVAVHIFLDQLRRFYDLERLWSDAVKVIVDPVTPGNDRTQ